MINKDIFWYNNIQILLNKDELYNFMPTKTMSKIQKLNSIVRGCLYLSILLTIFTNNINYILLFVISGISTYIIYINDKTIEKYEQTNEEQNNEAQTNEAQTNEAQNNEEQNNEEQKEQTNETQRKQTNKEPIEQTNNPEFYSFDRLTGNKFSSLKESNNIINSKFDFKNKKSCIEPTEDNPYMNILPTNDKDFYDKKACLPSTEIKNKISKIVNKFPHEDPFENNLSQRPFLTNPNYLLNGDKEIRDWLYKPATCFISYETPLNTSYGCSLFG